MLFDLRNKSIFVFQEKYGKHPNVNIFFTTDYQLIEIMLPLLPELTEAITVKITLKYHPFALRPYECSIKPNFPCMFEIHRNYCFSEGCSGFVFVFSIVFLNHKKLGS